MPDPWNELLRVALVGTDRIKLSASLLEKLKTLGISTDQDHARIILEGASFYSLMRRTGKASKSWDKSRSMYSPADGSKSCSSKTAYHLSLILDGTYEMALPEFIQHLSQNKKCLPPELLPDLLDRCIQSTELWNKIKPTIGARGQWLAKQNPYWAPLIQSPDIKDWETGSPDQRILLLKNLRRDNPSQALRLIRSTWQEDSLQQRVNFLKELDLNLSLKDEAFLENCLDDRRKEIRRIGADLLAKLPDAELIARIWDKLQSLMSFQKKIISKPKLEIALPEQITSQMIRDGIDPGAQWYKGGVKASRLGQMIAIIPPKKWETYFDNPAKEVLKIFVRSNWAELLLQAIVEATYRHKDKDWIEAIIDFWRDNQGRQRWLSFDPKNLLKVISGDSFNLLAIRSLEHKDKLMDENTPVTALLRAGLFPWEDQLTRLVIKNMQDWIAGETARYWSGWHLRSILNQAAYFCKPDLFEELRQGWTVNAGVWSSWEREIDQFLSILKFRKEMIEELKKDYF